MGTLAVTLLIAFGVMCLVIPAWRHRRLTGESPFIGGRVSGIGSVALYTVPFALAAANAAPTVPALAAVGTVLAVAGLVLVVWSQRAMGASWRVGIDDASHTTLVTRGPYRRVRNPIYTGMFAFAAGFTLVRSNVFSIVGTVSLVAVVTVVVWHVEEPYLLNEHGDEYAQWKRATGRFLPRLRAVA